MSCEFYREQIRKARKAHKCDLCRSKIEIGQSYYSESGKFDGEIFENHICNNCKSLQEAFFEKNHDDLDGGYTWDEIIDDINESVCYQCREENGDCNFEYYGTPKCEKARAAYKKLVQTQADTKGVK